MPLPEVPPVSQSLPTCATAFLYQLGDLYYYATIDCETGATGYGVLGSLITPQGCIGTTCAEGSTVEAKILRTSMIETATRRPGDRVRNDPYGRSRAFQRYFQRQAAHFADRALTASDVASRREAIASYLARDPGSLGATNLQRIFSLRTEARDLFLKLIAEELGSVRIGGVADASGVFLTKDRNLDIDTISAAPVGDLFDNTGGDLASTAAEPNFTHAGITSPFVKLVTPGNPHSGGNIDVFFRLQHVTLGGGSLHHVGQQIDVADLPVDPNRVSTVAWEDRHAHFHVIRATPDGGAATSYLVYSAEDLANREYIV